MGGMNKNVLQGISIFSTTDPRKWTIEELVNFVERLLTNNYTNNNSSELMRISQSLRNQDVDGDVFLMLTEEELTDTLNISLGPALKLKNAIIMLRQRVIAIDNAKRQS
ncbi:unnamed protein product [Macrosiphum euphorbiae]|uniref:SAM domain-containing protein n=1 Tax=Macrosiphum euphorbiae TaxID=13131 RepID=A0AAV0XJP6_9HEMI|nr:unnamed protein product [Macrosiphum euphorbiae]